LLAGLNIEVLRLIRIAIGPLALGDLPKGKIRELNREEKARLDKAMAGRSARAS
jgi:23S rRNA pseudouridine2605 synthase